MKKPMLIMLITLGILFGIVAGLKILKSVAISKVIAKRLTAEAYVSATKVGYSMWTPQLTAVGSLRGTLGVNVTTESPGMVKAIYFKPGTEVKKDTLLVQLDIDQDVAQLQAYQASADLAKITYDRDKAQYAFQGVSKATLDTDTANLKSAQAQVAQQEAVIAKKTIRAPFTGRLGISNVNPGQYVNPGDNIVTLQTLDPIYIDFYMPQQNLPKLKVGQPAAVTSDSFPNRNFLGKITTINPTVDTTTRNVEVEATIKNPQYELIPGMFATVTITTGAPEPHLTLPQTAVSFNPYGQIVYILNEADKHPDGTLVYKVKQSFVTTGEKRGDQIVILEGLKEGDLVVTAGQLKLKNNSLVGINNSVVPSNNPAPKPIDE